MLLSKVYMIKQVGVVKVDDAQLKLCQYTILTSHASKLFGLVVFLL